MRLSRTVSRRIFTWVNVVTLLLLVAVTNAEVLIMRRQDDNTSRVVLSCYFNGPQTESVGLGWILPRAAKPFNETSERWRHTARPGLLKGHFEYYGHIWQSMNSLEFNSVTVLPPVLDERWNDFPTVYTDGTSVFPRAIRIYTNRIHLSVLAKQDAHIALHSDINPYTSSTYWIALDQTGVTQSSSIRRCERGMPRSLLPRLDDCKIIRVGHQGLDMLSNGEEWVHLTIELIASGRTLTIRVKMANARDNSVHLLAPLTWTDFNAIRNIRFLSFRTKETPGKWKVHDYRLVVHNGKADGEGFNVFKLIQPYHCCLHLYYFFREGFGPAYVRSKDGNQSITLPPTNGKWKILKVRMDLTPPQDHIHFQPPIGDFSKSGPVFALSQPFRICGDDEFFLSRIQVEPAEAVNAKCMDIQYSDYAVMQNQTSLTASLPKCNDIKEFSKSCNITCARAVGDNTCRGKVLCYKDACMCTSAYKPTNQWNTTCLEEIESDIAPGPTMPDNQELDDVTEASIDEDVLIGLGEDGIPSTDDETPETAERSASSVCQSGKSKDVALIVLSVLLAAAVVCAVLASWYWVTQMSPQGQAFGVHWRGGNRIVTQLITDDDEA